MAGREPVRSFVHSFVCSSQGAPPLRCALAAPSARDALSTTRMRRERKQRLVSSQGETIKEQEDINSSCLSEAKKSTKHKTKLPL